MGAGLDLEPTESRHHGFGNEAHGVADFEERNAPRGGPIVHRPRTDFSGGGNVRFLPKFAWGMCGMHRRCGILFGDACLCVGTRFPHSQVMPYQCPRNGPGDVYTVPRYPRRSLSADEIPRSENSSSTLCFGYVIPTDESHRIMPWRSSGSFFPSRPARLKCSPHQNAASRRPGEGRLPLPVMPDEILLPWRATANPSSKCHRPRLAQNAASAAASGPSCSPDSAHRSTSAENSFWSSWPMPSMPWSALGSDPAWSMRTLATSRHVRLVGFTRPPPSHRWHPAASGASA